MAYTAAGRQPHKSKIQTLMPFEMQFNAFIDYRSVGLLMVAWAISAVHTVYPSKAALNKHTQT